MPYIHHESTILRCQGPASRYMYIPVARHVMHVCPDIHIHVHILYPISTSTVLWRYISSYGIGEVSGCRKSTSVNKGLSMRLGFLPNPDEPSDSVLRSEVVNSPAAHKPQIPYIYLYHLSSDLKTRRKHQIHVLSRHPGQRSDPSQKSWGNRTIFSSYLLT
jgi:hypothetical protein